jgi:hypothetical protein
MNIELTPWRIYLFFMGIICFLLISNLAGIAVLNFTVHDHAWGLISLFSFDSERNIPAFYSASAILLAALLLIVTGRLNQLAKESAAPWFFLGLVFVFLSFDEIASIHERLILPMRELFDASGAFYFAWVIPYGVAVLLLGFLYIPFLIRLPRRTAIIFVISGTLFVGGAIGVELIGGHHSEIYGQNNITYAMIVTLEELLEKVGIATFIYGILDYTTRRFGSIQANISSLARS